MLLAYIYKIYVTYIWNKHDKYTKKRYNKQNNNKTHVRAHLCQPEGFVYCLITFVVLLQS